MLDFVRCEYPLPLPEEVRDLKSEPDWSEVDFQTHSFDGSLETYTIEEDGSIYREILERNIVETEGGAVEIIEKENGIEKEEYTGELLFHGMHTEESYDYFFEFMALFWKGEIKEINLNKWEKESNKRRKLAQDQLSKKMNKIIKTQKKWWFPLYKFFYAVFSFFLGLIKYFLAVFLKICWKIESWLAPK